MSHARTSSSRPPLSEPSKCKGQNYMPVGATDRGSSPRNFLPNLGKTLLRVRKELPSCVEPASLNETRELVSRVELAQVVRNRNLFCRQPLKPIGQAFGPIPSSGTTSQTDSECGFTRERGHRPQFSRFRSDVCSLRWERQREGVNIILHWDNQVLPTVELVCHG